jgi:hypothetical protein
VVVTVGIIVLHELTKEDKVNPPAKDVVTQQTESPANSGSESGVGSGSEFPYDYWDKGEKGADEHYAKHGKEVGAKDEADYARKGAETLETNRNLVKRKWHSAKEVEGVTPNVRRIPIGGKTYLDVHKDEATGDLSIISYGRR